MQAVPGMHSSSLYSPWGFSACGASGGMSCSKPVPPSGSRTKRLAMGAVW